MSAFSACQLSWPLSVYRLPDGDNITSGHAGGQGRILQEISILIAPCRMVLAFCRVRIHVDLPVLRFDICRGHLESQDTCRNHQGPEPVCVLTLPGILHQSDCVTLKVFYARCAHLQASCDTANEFIRYDLRMLQP